MNSWKHQHNLERSARLRRTVVWAWVWAFVWAWAVCRATGTCPKVCECKWRDGKETVSCPHAEFIDIPRGLDPSTQVLDLKHNNLQILPRDAFVDTGLVNLQKVWLNYCNLKHMDRGAFNMLANLVELDLSHNMLRVVPSAALSDVPGLRELRLAYNDLTTLSEAAFTPTPDLVRLDLSHNLIDTVNERAFRGLTRLEVLKLSVNKLTTLDADMVVPLVAIHELHLDGNPWHCDCHLRPLRQWMKDRNVAFSEPPTCLLPGRVKGRSWQVLTLDEFVCIPKVTAVAPRILAAHGENVSLSCRVETDVDAAVTWLLGDRPLQNASESQRYRVLELVAPNHETRLSNLTIAGAAPRDEGTYRCVAHNKAGSVETNLTLQVSNEVAEVRLVTMDRVFVTGGLLSVVAIILVVLLFLTAIIVRRRQQMSRRRGQDSEHKNETPQSSQGRDSASSDSHPKLAEYHIVPTNDMDEPSPLPTHSDKSWMLRDASVDDFPSAKELEKSNVYNNTEQRRLTTAGQGSSGKTSSPSTVSYVEIPKSEMTASSHHTLEDRLRWKEQTFDSKDSLLRQASGQTGSQLSMGSVGHYPDLLDLPYTQQQQHEQQLHQPQHPGSTAQLLNPTYCTIPRRCASWMNLAESQGSTPSYVRPHMRPQLSLPDASPVRHAHRHTLADFMAVHRGQLVGDGGAAGGADGDSSDPCNLEYHAAQLEKFLLEYRSLQEQLYRMKESYEASHRADSLADDSNGDSEGDNVPPPCPEAPTTSPSPYQQTPTTSPFPRTPTSSPPMAGTPGSEPIRSILKKRYEANARGLPGLQGLLGLQSLQGLKGFQGIQGLQGLQGLQELQSLQGPFSKSAYHGEDPKRLRPPFSPSQTSYPDHES
ncbi:uncharacterized protein [Panulirus ornatus]|uniref:uncharacterized protein n=1 Tax=Panulirus ornatus TaxID=150431 RepID=UPI003A8A7760